MGRIERKVGRRNEGGAGSANRRWPVRIGLFASGLVVGVLLGSTGGGAALDAQAASGGPARRLPSVVARLEAPEGKAPAVLGAPTDESSAMDVLNEWIAMAESERLEAMARKVKGAGLDLVAESVIGRLEDDALKSLIASTTDFTAAELSAIEDVPRFAQDLARIAMDGTVREASEPEDSVRPIDFSEEITWDHRAAFAQSQFGKDAPRIYAAFESDGLGISQTLAKWTRVSDGEIMLFKRHRIRPAADSSYVYLDAPPTGWQAGEYRVDFYSADTELTWLASGSHRIAL